MKVGDIMAKEVNYVGPESKVTEIANLLQEKNFNGVPVVKEGKVVGMITEADLVTRGSETIHIPSLINLYNRLRMNRKSSQSEDPEIKNLFGANAESIMNKEFVSADENMSLSELINLFNEKHVNPIPVVDKEGFLKGIVSLSDIIKFISRFEEEELDFLRSVD